MYCQTTLYIYSWDGCNSRSMQWVVWLVVAGCTTMPAHASMHCSLGIYIS